MEEINKDKITNLSAKHSMDENATAPIPSELVLSRHQTPTVILLARGISMSIVVQAIDCLFMFATVRVQQG
jgi:hypothetical protein